MATSTGTFELKAMSTIVKELFQDCLEIRMKTYMKVNGSTIKKMDEEYKFIQMERDTMAGGRME